MARSEETEIRLRLALDAPAAGIWHSLQDKAGAPVDVRIAGAETLVFDVPVRLAPGPRFLGTFVRSEGPRRRFVYVASGAQAGQPGTMWSRRLKIDIHDIPETLLDAARTGATLEIAVAGRAADGGPASATATRLREWSVAQ